jgi:hypothetical protein
VGGNHEASNYLQELPYGGWVAPNIYYLGYAGLNPYQIYIFLQKLLSSSFFVYLKSVFIARLTFLLAN